MAAVNPVAQQLRDLRLRHAMRAALAVGLCSLLPVLALIVGRDASAMWLSLPLFAMLIAAGFAWRGSGSQLLRWLDDQFSALQDCSFLLQTTQATQSTQSTQAIQALTPVGQLQRQRIMAHWQQCRQQAPQALPPVLPRLAYPISVMLALALGLIDVAPPAATPTETRQMTAAVTATSAEVLITVTPPAYTGLAAFTAGGGDVTVPEASEVRFCLQGSGGVLSGVTVHWLDESERAFTGENPRCTRWTLLASTGYRLRRDGAWLPTLQGRLLLQPDTAPEIRIRQPERDVLEIDSQQYWLPLDLGIDDDYGVQRASLHWTLARGGGENVRFTDREQRLTAASDRLHWRHQQRIRLRDLGMEPGDELYFYLSAEDNRQPTGQQRRSRTYILRHPLPNETGEAGARLPADLGKAQFRSQRQIILDTEALISQRTQLSAETFRDRSERLAQDQLVLRLRYGEFLGEESSFAAAQPTASDGHDEHASGVHDETHPRDTRHDQAAAGGQAGHAHAPVPTAVGVAARAQLDVLATYGHVHDETENATLFDDATKAILRQALQAMWSAEAGLRLAQPQQALPFEYQALNAIKALQQAERIYLHKTAFSPPPLEASMRFSGEADALRPVHRQHAPLTTPEQLGLQRVLDALQQPEPMPLNAQLPVLRRWLQQRLQHPAHREDANLLATLAVVQDLQSGCTDCKARLRDHLLPYLSTPLPAATIAVPSAGLLHQQLQQALNPNPVRSSTDGNRPDAATPAAVETGTVVVDNDRDEKAQP